jgi:carbamoyl-phosphate synthase small subunit
MKAVMVLEDGKIFEGTGFGARGEGVGEVVFHTGMSGYQEILTDPSYNEQIVTMTYPQIGNYGVSGEDAESRKLFLRGFIVKENCEFPSNWRSEQSLHSYLKQNNIVGLAGIDTRALVRHLRDKGSKCGIISTREYDVKKLKAKLAGYPGLVNRDIVQDVTCKKKYEWQHGVADVCTGKQKKPVKKFKVVAVDFGIKTNILRMLRSSGCGVTVVPADSTAEEILKARPDGVFLSNGPGDPGPVTYAIKTIRDLLGKVPIFGICLGQQLLGLALGGKTYKLKFGHHGANHPVMNLKTKVVEITSQNHGFCVDMKSLKKKDVEVTHMNLNDNTVEGIRCKKLPAFSVQYHPEAAPGPHDSSYLFNDFIEMMSDFKK